MEALKRPNWDFSEERSENLLWLDKNECNYIPVKKLIEEIYKSINLNSLSTYPDLSETYYLFNTVFKINHGQSFLTYGSDGAIRSFFEFCNRKSNNINALLMKPTFGMYEVYAKYFCEKVICLDYPKFTKDFKIKVEILIEEINRLNKGDIFILANPESPLGFKYEEKDIRTIVNICSKKEIYILLDETYIGFSKSGHFHNDLLKLDLPNLFLTGSLSKSWGLAGIRLGYLISTKNNIDCAKLPRFMYEIGGFQSAILKACLENYLYFQKYLDEQIKNRDEFVALLEDNDFESINTSTNFIHINKNSLTERSLKNLSDVCIYKEINHASLSHLIRLTMPDPIHFDMILNALKY